MTKAKLPITAVILAGGRGSRMEGTDKGLVLVRGTPLVEHLITRLERQVPRIIVNANRNLETYASYGWPVVSDQNCDFQGPLAGMLAASQQCTDDYLITAPCDSPLLAMDYVARMYAALRSAGAAIAVASDGDRLQPVFALLSNSLAPDLADFLTSGGRKIDRWFAQHKQVVVNFSDQPTMFRNANTREDVTALGAEWPDKSTDTRS